jgi:hypothetical protein
LIQFFALLAAPDIFFQYRRNDGHPGSKVWPKRGIKTLLTS